MLGHFFLLFTLICVTKCEHSPSHSLEGLYTILDQTTEYFKNLTNVYKVLSPDTSSNINNAISKYVENTTRAVHQQTSERQRRDVQNNFQYDENVAVLQDFEETLSLNLTGFQDVDFFPRKDEDQLSWFAVALNSSNMLLFQVINNVLYPLGTYSQSAGKQIIVNNYGAGALIVIAQKDSDGIVVLHCGRNETGGYELQFKQEFEIPGVTYMNTWLCMNQVYLAIASKTNIFIYVWLGEHFDIIDSISFGARKVLPFRNKSFMHLVAVGLVTKIFRFSVRSNKFEETQRLLYAEDVDLFHFKEGHFEEQFLVLTGNSTILYKEMHDCFVPFQKVVSARYVHSLTIASTVVLLFSDEGITTIYQYNGWRFVSLKSHTKLSDVGRICRIRSYGEDALIQSQNGEWKFVKPIWITRKTSESTQNEIDIWCFKTLKRVSPKSFRKISDSPKNLVISNAYIERLRVQNINGYNAEELSRLTRQYKATINKLNLIAGHFAQETQSDKNLKSMIVRGKKLTVKCNRNCYIRRLITENKIKYETNAEMSTNKKMNSLKVNTINNWKCPIPNFNVDDIHVKESVNGISMQNLQEETLRISGDQDVSGKHNFTSLHATNVSMPFNIMTKSNKNQIVRIQKARVKELRLTTDNFFLPVNGSTLMINHSITGSKIRVTRMIDLRAAIKGEGCKKLEPVKDIFTPLTMSGYRFLRHVTFTDIVKVGNIVRTRGRSLKDIVENIIPLNSDVPTHLTLSSDKTSWNNVTLWGYKNWVTKNYPEIIIISGAKSAHNVVLTNTTYANLPLPRLTIPLCAAEIVTSEITTSSVTIDDLKVKTLNVSHIRGAYNMNTTVFESASTWDDVDFSTKMFTGHVVIKNISAAEIRGMDQIDFNSLRMYKWLDENRLKGPLNIEKLSANNLETPTSLNLSLPTRVRNVVVKADSDIKRINDIDVQLFMKDVTKMDDTISLEHTTFANGFTSNYVNARQSELNISHFADVLSHLYSKRISTTLKTSAINVLTTYYYFMSDVSSSFVVQGSARFIKEPIVKKIKNINLKQLSENVLWMADRDTVVFGNNIYFQNMTLKGDITIFDKYHPANSLFIRMWSDLSNRLLSKTKEQHVATVSSFKSVQVSSIVAANNSRLRSSDSNLNDLLTSSLMRNAAQSVNISWRFKELDINSLDDIYWNGKFNGLDLNTDIIRSDAKYNVVTGKKTISGLTVKNLWLLNTEFPDLVRNSLNQKCSKVVVIKGQKTFINITLNNLSVNGAIMGRKVEDMLLKSGNQRVFGVKRILGQLNAPTLITNITVNDVHLPELIDTQVKKHRAVQTIEGELDFTNNIEIFGNITVDKLYERVNIKNISSQDKLNAVLDRTTQIVEFTEDITAALQNRAIYVDKFEAVDESTLEIISNASNTENATDFHNTCLCESTNTSSYCNDTKLLNILAGINSGMLITKKLVLLGDMVFVIVISSDFVSISLYNVAENRIEQKIRLHVPGIFEASVESIDSSLWIILRLLEQTLILHYQTWNELEQYTLPGSDICITDKTLINQHLLIRSDGMWSLKGVFRPKHIFKVPLNGQIRVFADRADYYIKATTENSTVVLKARYVGYKN